MLPKSQILSELCRIVVLNPPLVESTVLVSIISFLVGSIDDLITVNFVFTF